MATEKLLATFRKSKTLEVRATLGPFKGKDYLRISEYYEKNGEMLPSPKGFSIEATPENIINFRTFLKELNLELKELDI